MFLKMAMQRNPDKFASKSDEEKAAAQKKFKEIDDAYEVLKDAKLEQRLRRRHRQAQARWRLRRHGGMGGVDCFSDIFEAGGGHHHFALDDAPIIIVPACAALSLRPLCTRACNV